MEKESREFLPDELREHDGRNASESYVAHEGKVYDVSGSKMWKEGKHMRRHQAGADLTEDIKGAPHGPEVLERIPQVGTLKPEKDPMDENVPEFLLKILDKVPMLRRHPHPMTVHFPLAFCMVVPLFNILFLITGQASLEVTGFYMLALCLPSAAVALTTGPYTWWLNYGAVLSRNIRIKLSVSLLLFLLLLAGFFWRLLQPEVLHTLNGPGAGYLLLTCTYPVLVSILGWFGAEMTFPA
jgi:predicted heme/steroid binding protein/uncharacterized membrane protein